MAGLLLLVGWLGETFFGFPHLVSVGLYLAAYVFGGMGHRAPCFSRPARASLRHRFADGAGRDRRSAAWANLPKARCCCSCSAWAMRWKNARWIGRAPPSALWPTWRPRLPGAARRAGDRSCRSRKLQLDDVVIVRPGVRLPIDGEIVVGQSGVNQAPVTGESVPVDKTVGDKVFAGSINGEGALEVQVTRLAKDSTLARVIEDGGRGADAEVADAANDGAVRARLRAGRLDRRGAADRHAAAARRAVCKYRFCAP